jgi:hypothetical protein
MTKQAVTPECVEQLHTWVKAHCPCALEEPMFLQGLIEIANEAVKDALLKERNRLFEMLRTPSQQ